MTSDLPAKTVLFEFKSSLDAIGKNTALRDERNFDRRREAIDFIEFQLIEPMDELQGRTVHPDKLILLKQRAERLKTELEEIDINLFQRLRTEIRSGRFTGDAFKNLVREYFAFDAELNVPLEQPGYDNFDIFINGLLSFQKMPAQTRDLEHDMVYFQKTPARIILELVERSHFRKGDVFFDVGAGLGQVVILVNLLAGIPCTGIEFEPAFCTYAADCAKDLHLTHVRFMNMDARKADYSEGTVFFMFTPFRGEILLDVLELLKKESVDRKIKIITYGPCTEEVARQSWLKSSAPNDDNIYKLAVFTS